MFVETTSGRLVRMSHIDIVSSVQKRVRLGLGIGPQQHESWTEFTRTIFFADDSAEVTTREWDRAVARLAQIVPAEPGTYCAIWGIDTDSNEEFVIKEPVLAWRVDEYAVATPVRCEVNWGDEEYALLFPDGRVIELEDCAFETIEAWKRAKRRVWEEKRAKEKAKLEKETSDG